MQVTEVNSEGLKRKLKVTIAQDELGQRFDRRLDEIKDRVQIKGFRRGKVPVAHLKKLYGRSLMAEIVDQAVKETSTQAITERKERPAMQPAIDLPEDKDEIERIIDGKSDLAYQMTFEVLPEIDLGDLSAIKLERLVADVEPAAIDEAVGELAKRSTTYEAEEGRVAGDGDRVTLDFVGKIDGVPFDGGSGEDMEVVLGRGNFIPGFEDGLAGIKAGDERVVTATFPETIRWPIWPARTPSSRSRRRRSPRRRSRRSTTISLVLWARSPTRSCANSSRSGSRRSTRRRRA